MRHVIAIVASLLLSAAAHAQGYPSRPIKMIVPFPPGGGFDAIARPFSEKLSALIGQPVLIENRPGAGGNIGTEAAKRATPDGYTLFFANDLLSTNPNLYNSVPFDSIHDFVPITMVGTTAVAMAINPSVPAKDVKELMALSQGKPLYFGTPGVGSGPHLFGEMLNLNGTMKLVHVPYKGTMPAVTDTIGGQIQMVITSLSSIAPHIRAGRLRGVCVLSEKRAALMPELPTLAESGLPGVNYEVWYGLFAPAGTPESVLRRVREAAVEALAQPDLMERLRRAGYEPTASTPEVLAALIKGDLEKWRRVVNDANIPRQ